MTDPRLFDRLAAAAYCNLKPRTFDAWVRSGRLPKALPRTRRWDRRAINQALDRLSGIVVRSPVDEDRADFERRRLEAERRQRGQLPWR